MGGKGWTGGQSVGRQIFFPFLPLQPTIHLKSAKVPRTSAHALPRSREQSVVTETGRPYDDRDTRWDGIGGSA